VLPEDYEFWIDNSSEINENFHMLPRVASDALLPMLIE
jgi:hypothetical protein